MKKSKKKRNKNILGISLGILLLIITIIFLIFLRIINIIPNVYYLCLLVIVFIVTLLIEFFLLIKKKSVVLTSFKIFSCILSISLMGIYTFGIYYLSKTASFLDNIGEIKEEITNYYIIVLNDSKYQETSDLYGLRVGYYENTNVDVIDSIKLDFVYVVSNDSMDLKNKLFNNEVDAIILSDIIKNKLEEDDLNFSNSIRILETISIKNKIEDITKKVSIKNTPFNVLISGIDAYGDINQTSRNDVNIVATINPITNQILLTSIPRDYYVQLHGTTGYKDKLTHASYYGTNMAVQTIEDILGIDINYYVKVNFSTVVDLVDELGGIQVYADQKVYLGKCSIKEGINNLDGECALAFARERHSYIDGDRHRGRNQQEVIKAIFNKVSNGSTIITEYTNILNVLDGKFATNMDMDEVLNLVKYEINDLKNYYIESIQVDGYGSMGKTYSYPYEDLWIMIPDEKTISDAKEVINKVLNNERIGE